MIPLGVLASSYVAPAGGGASFEYLTTIYGGTFSTPNYTYTFSDVSFGTAASNRTLIIATHSRGAARRFSTLTVGGEAATSQAGGQDDWVGVDIWTVPLPSGTSGNVVAYAGAGSEARAISVWAAYGTLAYSSGSFSGVAGASITLTAPENCLTIAAQAGVTATVGTAYVGVTERARNNTTYMGYAAGDAQPDAGSHTVSATGSSSTNMAAVVVDFTLI